MTTGEAAGSRRHVPIPALVTARHAVTGGGDAPLFMVTAGYGDLMALTQLGRLLEGDFPVYALQPPVPAPAPPDAQGYVAAYVAAMRAAQPTGPYRLIGYSTGGLMAYLIAQALADSRAQVSFLGLIDAPCGLSRGFVAAHRIGRRLVGGWLRGHAARLGSVGQMAARLLGDPGLAAQVDALAGPPPLPYAGRATLILPEEPSWARRFQQIGRWRRVAREVEVRHVPGDHTSCLRAPHVASLAARLDGWLAAARADV